MSLSIPGPFREGKELQRSFLFAGLRYELLLVEKYTEIQCLCQLNSGGQDRRRSCAEETLLAGC
jgi:hypothetical protein